MPPITETFYFPAIGKKANFDEIQRKTAVGSGRSGIVSLYSDKELTKKVGSVKFENVLLDNTNPIVVNSISHIITTQDGTISYSFIRRDYNKVTVETQQTTGKYTKGTITRTYEGDDKELRKIVYKSST
jgi:hypothetical protein